MMYNDQTKPAKILRKLLYGLLFVIIFLLLNLALMLLWNAILPGLTHLAKINYWQALGLMVLGRILFGRFHFGGMRGWQRDDGRQELKGKLMGMNEDERASFKEEWRKRCEGKG